MPTIEREEPSLVSRILLAFRNKFKKPFKEKEAKNWFANIVRLEDSNSDTFSVRYPPEELELLCKQTGLNKRQLRFFYRAFKGLCPNGAIKEQTFTDIFGQLFPYSADGNAYARLIFKAIDNKNSGCLTFSDLVCELSSIIKGSLEDRISWIFRLYDINRDGQISKTEMSEVIRAIHDLMGFFPERCESQIHSAFEKFDLNSDGVITIDEFSARCSMDQAMCQAFEKFNTW